MATSFVICGFNNLYNNKISTRQRFDPLLPSSSTTTVAVTSLSLPKSVAAGLCFSPANRRFLRSGSWSSQHGNRSRMQFIVYSGDQVGDLLPFGISLPENWPAWIPGLLVGVIASFFTTKWGPFAKFKEELDKAEVMVDKVADKVEEVAEKVEDFVGDIADDLPADSSFKVTLEKIEKAADKIGKDAKMVSDMVDKMDDLEAKVEDMMDDMANQKKNTYTKTDVNAKIEPQSTNL